MNNFFSSLEFQQQSQKVDQLLTEHLRRRQEDIDAFSPQLLEAMTYSLFNGGKRFRPVLSLFVAEGLGVTQEHALPWAAALEMIHSYSLIHDDLPCMDNDDLRRGQPTSHKKFGEAVALLAGDALLTESFLVLAQNYTQKNQSGLFQLLATAAGASGMVGGQAMDMGRGQTMANVEDVRRMHAGKTGALIAAAVRGAGHLTINPREDLPPLLKKLGEEIGLAFQIKDDLLDLENDPRSYIHHLGVAGTEKALIEVSHAARQTLAQLPPTCKTLLHFISANAERTQ